MNRQNFDSSQLLTRIDVQSGQDFAILAGSQKAKLCKSDLHEWACLADRFNVEPGHFDRLAVLRKLAAR